MKKWREIPPTLVDSHIARGILYILGSTLQEYYMHIIIFITTTT